MSKLKYIVFNDNGFSEFVVFPETLVHRDIARAVRAENILGAGFCNIHDDKFVCYGESISLGVKCRRDGSDSEVLNRST
jgi:hypothetical protein